MSPATAFTGSGVGEWFAMTFGRAFDVTCGFLWGGVRLDALLDGGELLEGRCRHWNLIFNEDKRSPDEQPL
jgi:hypothetical protein